MMKSGDGGAEIGQQNAAGLDCVARREEKDYEVVMSVVAEGPEMSGTGKSPSLGTSEEIIARKRGRPKKVKAVDDEGAAGKRQKIGVGADAEVGVAGAGANAPSIVIPVEERGLQSRDEARRGDCQELEQGGREFSVPTNNKQNAIPGGDREESTAVENDRSKEKEVYDDVMKGRAWEVVLEVHGNPKPATGGAAHFPGETGQGGVSDPTLCSCCKQPEIKRQTIVCDACELSFHISCMKLASGTANHLDDWVCPSCTTAPSMYGGVRALSKLGQLCRDKKLGREGNSNVSQKGQAGTTEICLDDHESKLDLNFPAEPLAPGVSDQVPSQNGRREESSRQQPSAHLLSRTDLQEFKQEGRSLSTASPREVISGIGYQDRQASDSQHRLLRDCKILSSESSANVPRKSNGQCSESDRSNLTEAGESFRSHRRDAAADMIERDSFAILGESGNVNNVEKAPEKLAILSKELGRIVLSKPPDITREPLEVSGSKATSTPAELAGIPKAQVLDFAVTPDRALESKLFLPKGVYSTIKGSNILSSSFNSSLNRLDDISENVMETNWSKIFDTTGRAALSNSLDTSLMPTVGTWGATSGDSAKPIEFQPSYPFFMSQAMGESRPFDSGLRAGVNISSETVGASLEGLASRQHRPFLPTFNHNEVHRVDLSGVSHSEQNDPQSTTVHYVDLAGLVHHTVQGDSSQVITEDALQVEEQQQLKKVGEETLQQLKDFIKEKHGLFLADGWEVEVRKRKNERHLDKYYISPEKQRFRSRIEVMRHLGLSDGLKGKFEPQQSQPKDWSSMVQKLAKGKEELQLPFKCGDLTIESLGEVDVRPCFRSELQIWPVGYRSTWHDSTTASFCISEVVDKGTSAPIFRVTRKFCPTLAMLSNVTAGATLSSFDKARNIGGYGKGDWGMNHEETTAFQSRPFFSGLRERTQQDRESPYPHGSVSDQEDRESLKALLGDLGGPVEEQDGPDAWESSQPKDAIGEFTVEGGSTAQAWRLFAEMFVDRCKRAPWVLDLLPDICPHFKFGNGPDQIWVLETAGANSHESWDARFTGLLEKLGEDRFGLSETLVKGMIEALPNAGDCMGYKSLEQRGLCWRANDPAVNPLPQSRFRAREKARKHKKAPEVLNDEESGMVDSALTIDMPEVITVPPFPKQPPQERPPPPAGRPLSRRLPPEIVGDVLQIWEFLSRFADVIGQAQPVLLEDLEEGLICGAPIVNDHLDRSSSLAAHHEESGGNNIKSELDAKAVLAGDADISITADGNSNGDLGESPQTELKATESSSLLSMVSRQSIKDGPQDVHQQDDRKSTTGNAQPASPVDGIKPDHVTGEDLRAGADKSPVGKWVISSGFATASAVHIPLINYLLSDLQSKVCGPDEVPGETEESKPSKRGRKRLRDTVFRPVFGREKLSESFSMNEWTWPEIARRYMISFYQFAKIADTSEPYSTEECLKVLRCIQGDGGVLCGALDGVAGMEVDAQLLAEAEKELLNATRDNEDTPTPNTPPQSATSKDVVEDGKAHDGSGESPSWIKILDPIAKLPTNVGSRIRNRVRDALEAGPPDWAVVLLEQSIHKDVYKGNASGPTKRLVMEVLSKYRGEDPKIRKSKKLRKRVLPSPEVVMQRCRIVLRQVAAADSGRIVSNTFGTIIINFYQSDGEALLARPLDFRAIDLRLGAGAYGTSPAAFAADVRQIWKNVSSACESDSDKLQATSALSELFESLYSKQVITFQGGVDNLAATGTDGKITSDSGDGKPTGEQPPGPDAGESVKAPWEDDSCRICGIDDDHDNVLLCDGCDAEYHIYCLNPQLPEVPEGNWYCSSCVAVDKGFLEVPVVSEAVTERKVSEKQDEQLQQKFSSEDGPEKEELRSGDLSENGPLWALAMKLEETDYWHLNLAERVAFLKFLCDQALDTHKVRIHMEDTVDVATELQQKLRHSIAERWRYAELQGARLDASKDTTNVLSGNAMKRQPGEFGSGTVTGSDSLQRPSNRVTGLGEIDLNGQPNSDQRLSSGVGFEVSLESTVKGTVLHSSLQDTPKLKIQVKEVKEGGGKDLLNNETTVDAMDAYISSEPESQKACEGHEQKPVPILEGDGKPSDTCMSLNEFVRESKDLTVSRPNELTAGDGVIKNNAQALKAEVGKVSLPRGLSTPLDAEIKQAVTKLMTVNLRRDLLGKDDNGREYWALFGSKGTPWLAVEVVSADGKCGREGVRLSTEAVEEHRSANAPSVHSFEGRDAAEIGKNPDQSSWYGCTAGPACNTSGRERVGGEEVQMKQEYEDQWNEYSDEGMFDRLIEWLLPTSAQEKALKSTLLQWRWLLLIHKIAQGEQLEGPVQVSSKPGALAPDDQISQNPVNAHLFLQDAGGVPKKQAPAMPLLRATRLLERMYGPFGNYASKEVRTPAAPKRGRKKKTQPMEELTRCKCLEPVWVSRCHCLSCHITFASAADLEVHLKGSSCTTGGNNVAEQETGKKPGRKGAQTGKYGLSSKPPETPSPEQLSAIITLPPDVSTMPFIVTDSIRDRINSIGLIADKGPTFAPGLSFAPAFDPSLMILDSLIEHPFSLSEEPSGNNQQLLDTLAVGGTSLISHGDMNNSKSVPWVMFKSSEDLPGKMDGISQTSTYSTGPKDPFGVSLLAVTPFGSLGDAHKPDGLHSSDSTAHTSLWKESELQVNMDHFANANANASLGFSLPGRTKAGDRLFQVTGKQLVISRASLLPLDAKDLDLLQQLKMNFLDIEAVLSSDMLEVGRAYSSRRQAWRSLVKSAKTIYVMVQASILLEQMICADFLKSSWCYWSSFSAAAKTATLSSLFLRVCALDAAIVYENSGGYTGPEISVLDTKQSKNERNREEKRKGSRAVKLSAKKRRKDDLPT